MYFSKYDGPHSQIADPQSLDGIRTSGLQDLLDSVVIGWAKERPLVHGVEHRIVQHPEDKQMYTTAELFDDLWFRPMVRPWTPWNGTIPSPLNHAAAIGDGDQVDHLLEASNFSQEELNAALLSAVGNDYDNSEVINLLLKAGAEINSRDPRSGSTVLMLSIGRPIHLPTLIERGADINARDPKGSTALELARKGGHVEAAQILQKARPQG